MAITDRPVERRTLAPRHRPAWAPAFLGSGRLLGILGAIGVIVGLFLPWRDGGVHPSDVPVQFLWDRTTSATDPSLLIFLIPLAALLAVGAVVWLGAGLRLLGAIGVLIVTGLFAYQLDRSLFGGASLDVVLDTGFYFAAIGGIVAFVSALLPGRRRLVR